MAANRSSAEYGVPYVDQEAVSNPETQMAANKFNRLGEDVAQMTRVAKKVDVVFTTSSVAGPTAVRPTSGKAQWGTGSPYRPTVSKTATGQYTVTWNSSYADALDGTQIYGERGFQGDLKAWMVVTGNETMNDST